MYFKRFYHDHKRKSGSPTFHWGNCEEKNIWIATTYLKKKSGPARTLEFISLEPPVLQDSRAGVMKSLSQREQASSLLLARSTLTPLSTDAAGSGKAPRTEPSLPNTQQETPTGKVYLSRGLLQSFFRESIPHALYFLLLWFFQWGIFGCIHLVLPSNHLKMKSTLIVQTTWDICTDTLQTL